MANSYLGRRTRKRDGRKKEGLWGERRAEGGGVQGSRARPAATFHRIIIVISLAGLDSVVPSWERGQGIRITEKMMGKGGDVRE